MTVCSEGLNGKYFKLLEIFLKRMVGQRSNQLDYAPGKPEPAYFELYRPLGNDQCEIGVGDALVRRSNQ